MEKSVIIVGAGMAGLSAGCYARMNGYKARIYEMHTIAGGLCTAWKKRGYTFDISMHMLTGSVSGPFHKMWKELGGNR
jgi:phytoene dehydrogenase-like protein